MTSSTANPTMSQRPRNTSRVRWVLPFALLIPTSAVAQFTAFEAAIARFDADVSAAVAEDAGGAVSVAVFQGSQVIWTKGWGWADIENRVAANAETIGRTGSISKSFTAVLMMQLVERGVIGLDEPVAKYFPEIDNLADPPQDAAPITFRMLASHTAGLVREPDLEGAASGTIYRWEEKILESIPRTGFKTSPQTEYSYSNIGFGMLGLNSSTFMLDSPDLYRRMSVGYSRDRRTGELSAAQATREHFGRGYKIPNGGVYSTVGDLATFAAAMMGETAVQILSAASRNEMLNPQAPAENYGLGFSVRVEDGVTIVGHGGSVAGYNANLSFDTESKLGVAMLRTTSYNPPTGDLLRSLISASR